MIAIGYHRFSALKEKRRHLVSHHYSGHTPLRDNIAVRQQVLMNTLGPVTLLTGFEEAFDLCKQIRIPNVPIRLTLIPGCLTGPKTIEPAPRYLKETT